MLSGILAILFRLNPLLLLILIFIQSLMLLVLINLNKTRVKITENLVPINRKYGYLVNSIAGTEPQKDIRLYDMSRMLSDRIIDYNHKMMAQFIHLANKTGLANSIIAVINYTVSGLTMLFTGFRIISTRLGAKLLVGDFVLYSATVLQFSNQMNLLLHDLGSFSTNMHFLTPYKEKRINMRCTDKIF